MLQGASKGELENEFGTSNEDEAVLKILEKGSLQEFEVWATFLFTLFFSVHAHVFPSSVGFFSVPPLAVTGGGVTTAVPCWPVFGDVQHWGVFGMTTAHSGSRNGLRLLSRTLRLLAGAAAFRGRSQGRTSAADLIRSRSHDAAGAPDDQKQEYRLTRVISR